MSRQLDHVDQVFSRAPIYETIFSMLSPRELVRMSRSCQVIHDACIYFLRRAYNINRHLSRFFSDPIAFRSLQARTGTLISGSNALQFLDRTFYAESDLDIYTHPGHTLELLDWLTAAEGYRYEPRILQASDYRVDVPKWDPVKHPVSHPLLGQGDYTELDGIRAIFTFVKNSSDGEERLKIQVMEAHVCPFSAILAFHSSCVLNFIAFDCAYSLYPIPTFETRELLITKEGVHQTELPIIKYKNRGWRLAQADSDELYSESSYWKAEVIRSPLDSTTWRVPLDMTGVDVDSPLLAPSMRSMTWDPVTPNTWTLAAETNGLVVDILHVAQSPFLRYKYLIADFDLSRVLARSGVLRPRDNATRVPSEIAEQIWLDAEFPRYLEEARDQLEHERESSELYSLEGRMANISLNGDQIM